MKRYREQRKDVFPQLTEFDVVILSDVSINENSDLASLINYLNNDVRMEGKSLIITGGYGLSEGYNRFGKENLGGEIVDKNNDRVEITESEDNIGIGLVFKGYNVFHPVDSKEVISWWDNGLPATIVHIIGRGNVITFTSDCSPSWGTPSIKTENFRVMWKQIMKKYC